MKEVNYYNILVNICFTRALYHRIEWRTSDIFNNQKFVFKHSFSDSPSMNFWLIFFSSQAPPTCHEYVSRKPRFHGYPATRIQSSFGLPDRPETLIHPPIYEATSSHPPSNRMMRGASPRDLLYTFVFSSHLLLFLRGRRWKRWLRGSEKLIISDTNLSGLLGGW